MMSSEMLKYQQLQGQCRARPTPPGFQAALDEVADWLRFDADRARDWREWRFEDESLAVTLCYFVNPHHPVGRGGPGVVTIDVYRGSLEVAIEDEVYRLHCGQMLVLSPALEHISKGGDEAPMRLSVIPVTEVPCGEAGAEWQRTAKRMRGADETGLRSAEA